MSGRQEDRRRGAYVSDAGGFASQVALVGSYPNVTSWGAAAHEAGLFLGDFRLTVSPSAPASPHNRDSTNGEGKRARGNPGAFLSAGVGGDHSRSFRRRLLRRRCRYRRPTASGVAPPPVPSLPPVASPSPVLFPPFVPFFRL